MNISTNDEQEMKKAGGAFADGLTLVRFLLTPVVVYLIIVHGWPGQHIALLVAGIFAIAAITDLFDDMTGGTERSQYRKFGWFDDIADMVLICGTLAAMIFVFLKASSIDLVAEGGLKAVKPPVPWIFIIPALIIIAREIIVGLIKGFEMNKLGPDQSKLATLKTALIMLGTCIILAWPWLSSWIASFFAKGGDVVKVMPDFETGASAQFLDPGVFDAYTQASSIVWNIGVVILWIGAVLSLMTAILILTSKSKPANDG